MPAGVETDERSELYSLPGGIRLMRFISGVIVGALVTYVGWRVVLQWIIEVVNQVRGAL
mgnify:CR=1 FL=1